MTLFSMTFLDVLPAMALSLIRGRRPSRSLRSSAGRRRFMTWWTVRAAVIAMAASCRCGGLAPGVSPCSSRSVFAPWIRAGARRSRRCSCGGFAIGVAVLLVGGAWDDARPLPPRLQILFPALARRAGRGVGHAGRARIASARRVFPRLGTWLGVVWPADPLTFWILVATYATKLRTASMGS